MHKWRLELEGRIQLRNSEVDASFEKRDKNNTAQAEKNELDHTNIKTMIKNLEQALKNTNRIISNNKDEQNEIDSSLK